MKFLNFFTRGEAFPAIQDSNKLLMLSTIVLDVAPTIANVNPVYGQWINTIAVSFAALALPNFMAFVTRGRFDPLYRIESPAYEATASILLGLGIVTNIFKDRFLPGLEIREQLLPYQALAAAGLGSTLVANLIEDFG